MSQSQQMRVVLFHSYKGGMGKSLTALNFAACVIKLGESCALLEMDFDGPSLTHKLRPVFDAEMTGWVRPGLLRFFLNHVRRDMWEQVGCRHKHALGKDNIGGPPSWSFDPLAKIASDIDQYDVPLRNQKSRRKTIEQSLHEEPSKAESRADGTAASINGEQSDVTRRRRRSRRGPNEQALNDDPPNAKSQRGGAAREVSEMPGTIHFFPAGNSNDPAFADAAESTLRYALFGFHALREKGLVTRDELLAWRQYFYDIKSAIATLRPAPKYLIIDMPAGRMDQFATLCELWRPTVVSMFVANDENVEFVRDAMAAADERSEYQGDNPIRVIPVLARYPMEGLTNMGDQITEFTAIAQLSKSKEGISVIRSDRHIERREEIRVGIGRPAKNTHLTHDYLRLFCKLLDPADVKGDASEDLYLRLRRQIKVDSEEPDQERLFKLVVDTGALLNDDQNRNVSFKVETFQLLLDGLRRGFAVNDAGKLQEALRSAGRACGQRFGRVMSDEWEKEALSGSSQRKGVDAKINQWCAWDSNVGFGRFEMVVRDDWKAAGIGPIATLGDKLQSVDIILLESFLTWADDTQKSAFENGEGVEPDRHRYCELMTGYIEGVVAGIFRSQMATFEVKHGELKDDLPWVQELRGSARHLARGCVFHVEPAQLASHKE